MGSPVWVPASLTVAFRPVAGPAFRGAVHSPNTTRESAYSGDPNIRTSPVLLQWRMWTGAPTGDRVMLRS